MPRFIPGQTITDCRRILVVNDDYSLSYLDGASFGASVCSLGDEWRQVTILEQTLAGAGYDERDGYPEPTHRFGARYDVGEGRVALCVFPGTPRAWTVTGARRRLTWPEVAAFIPDDHQIAPLRNVLADASSVERRGTAHFGDCVRVGNGTYAIFAFGKVNRAWAVNSANRRMTLDEAREFAHAREDRIEQTDSADPVLTVTSREVPRRISFLDFLSDVPGATMVDLANLTREPGLLDPLKMAERASKPEGDGRSIDRDAPRRGIYINPETLKLTLDPDFLRVVRVVTPRELADEAKADEATNGLSKSDNDSLHDMSDLMREMLRSGEQVFRDLTEMAPIPDEVRDKAGRFLSDLTKAVSNLKD